MLDVDALTRPIIGIENRTAQEAFDTMCDRFRRAALPSGVVPVGPEGWVLVPREPTPEMCSGAAAKALYVTSDAHRAVLADGYARIYRDLIAAAPASPQSSSLTEEPAAVALLRGALSQRATSAEFNEWQAREVVAYIDALRAAALSPVKGDGQ